MRALILEAPGVVSLQEVPIPLLEPGDVLVRVMAATTCGTDLKAFRRGHPLIPMPGVFGHEYSGVVEAVGEGAPFQPGEAVMGVHSAPCQACYWCARGQENLCETLLKTLVLGSFAEFIRIPARIARLNLFPKPEKLSFEEAALLEPLACVMQGMSMLPLRSDASVLVIGPGAIGLLFVAALKSAGVKHVELAFRCGKPEVFGNKSVRSGHITISRERAKRMEVGASFGAEFRCFEGLERYNGRGYDIVIECTGQVSVWESAVNLVRRGGTVMLFGGPPGGTKVSFDTHRLHYDQITLLSPFHFGTAAVRAARGMLVEGPLDLSPLISGERKLEDGRAVFEDLNEGRGIKYVFRPG